MSTGFRNAEWGLRRTSTHGSFRGALVDILAPEGDQERTAKLPTEWGGQLQIKKRFGILGRSYSVHYEPLCIDGDPDHEIWKTQNFEELVSYVWAFALLLGEKHG